MPEIAGQQPGGLPPRGQVRAGKFNTKPNLDKDARGPRRVVAAFLAAGWRIILHLRGHDRDARVLVLVLLGSNWRESVR